MKIINKIISYFKPHNISKDTTVIIRKPIYNEEETKEFEVLDISTDEIIKINEDNIRLKAYYMAEKDGFKQSQEYYWFKAKEYWFKAKE
jgi:hypothetical protein